MTSYAARDGGAGGLLWSWEMRSVNARGLDLRFRLPERMGALEIALRDRLGKVLTRGSVSLSLRFAREEGAGAAHLDEVALAAALSALTRVEAAAEAKGLVLDPPRGSDILALRGVFDTGATEIAPPEPGVLMADFEPLLDEFLQMRAAEGAALAAVLEGQLSGMAALIEAAATRATERQAAMAEAFRANVAKVLDAAEGIDEARIAQELALLAVKSDVTEEIDRLRAHVAAARELLAAEGPVGRKLDFLMQEFNREANTLCSKSSDTGLTRLGLDLKLLIDQMREQVQNVE